MSSPFAIGRDRLEWRVFEQLAFLPNPQFASEPEFDAAIAASAKAVGQIVQREARYHSEGRSLGELYAMAATKGSGLYDRLMQRVAQQALSLREARLATLNQQTLRAA
jgi:hypothetical protein